MISMERKKELLNKIQRLNSYHEIQNTMGRATAALNFQNAEELLSYFALEQEDVNLEYADEGLFIGKEAVSAAIHDLIVRPKQKGYLLDMQLTTPIIEVAKDNQTAKAIWWCPGIQALPQEEKDPKALWCWGNIAVDWINVDGVWKIWHFHYFRVMHCDYEKGWVDDLSMINRPNTSMHPLSNPTTYHNPYSPLSIRDGIPACPKPYETYDDAEWMLKRDKQ